MQLGASLATLSHLGKSLPACSPLTLAAGGQGLVVLRGGRRNFAPGAATPKTPPCYATGWNFCFNRSVLPPPL